MVPAQILIDAHLTQCPRAQGRKFQTYSSSKKCVLSKPYDENARFALSGMRPHLSVNIIGVLVHQGRHGGAFACAKGAWPQPNSGDKTNYQLEHSQPKKLISPTSGAVAARIRSAARPKGSSAASKLGHIPGATSPHWQAANSISSLAAASKLPSRTAPRQSQREPSGAARRDELLRLTTQLLTHVLPCTLEAPVQVLKVTRHAPRLCNPSTALMLIGIIDVASAAAAAAAAAAPSSPAHAATGAMRRISLRVVDVWRVGYKGDIGYVPFGRRGHLRGFAHVHAPRRGERTSERKGVECRAER
eukprot:6180437-Pleurochrysis_carterae.AAC.7